MTYKYRDFKFKEYTRTSKYLKPDDFIMMNDPEGFVAFMKVAQAEVIGLTAILFADEFNGIPSPLGGVRPAGAPPPVPTASGPFVPMNFLTPSRDNRLIQARPTIFALYRQTAPPNALAGQLVPYNQNMVDVWVQWVHPFYANRGGSEQQSALRMNVNSGAGGIPQNVGGKLGGAVSAEEIYTRDDPNENYDVFVMYGTVPGYRILNNHTKLDIGSGPNPPAGSNVGLKFDWYLAFQGYRYVIEPVSANEYSRLKEYKLPFTPIPVGGVPQSSQIRAGGV